MRRKLEVASPFNLALSHLDFAFLYSIRYDRRHLRVQMLAGDETTELIDEVTHLRGELLSDCTATLYIVGDETIEVSVEQEFSDCSSSISISGRSSGVPGSSSSGGTHSTHSSSSDCGASCDSGDSGDSGHSSEHHSSLYYAAKGSAATAAPPIHVAVIQRRRVVGRSLPVAAWDPVFNLATEIVPTTQCTLQIALGTQMIVATFNPLNFDEEAKELAMRQRGKSTWEWASARIRVTHYDFMSAQLVVLGVSNLPRFGVKQDIQEKMRYVLATTMRLQHSATTSARMLTSHLKKLRAERDKALHDAANPDFTQHISGGANAVIAMEVDVNMFFLPEGIELMKKTMGLSSDCSASTSSDGRESDRDGPTASSASSSSAAPASSAPASSQSTSEDGTIECSASTSSSGGGSSSASSSGVLDSSSSSDGGASHSDGGASSGASHSGASCSASTSSAPSSSSSSGFASSTPSLAHSASSRSTSESGGSSSGGSSSSGSTGE